MTASMAAPRRNTRILSRRCTTYAASITSILLLLLLYPRVVDSGLLSELFLLPRRIRWTLDDSRPLVFPRPISSPFVFVPDSFFVRFFFFFFFFCFSRCADIWTIVVTSQHVDTPRRTIRRLYRNYRSLITIVLLTGG